MRESLISLSDAVLEVHVSTADTREAKKRFREFIQAAYDLGVKDEQQRGDRPVQREGKGPAPTDADVPDNVTAHPSQKPGTVKTGNPPKPKADDKKKAAEKAEAPAESKTTPAEAAKDAAAKL